MIRNIILRNYEKEDACHQIMTQIMSINTVESKGKIVFLHWMPWNTLDTKLQTTYKQIFGLLFNSEDLIKVS